MQKKAYPIISTDKPYINYFLPLLKTTFQVRQKNKWKFLMVSHSSLFKWLSQVIKNIHRFQTEKTAPWNYFTFWYFSVCNQVCSFQLKLLQKNIFYRCFNTYLTIMAGSTVLHRLSVSLLKPIFLVEYFCFIFVFLGMLCGHVLLCIQRILVVVILKKMFFLDDFVNEKTKKQKKVKRA